MPPMIVPGATALTWPASANVKLVRVVSGPANQQRLVDFTVHAGHGSGTLASMGMVTGNTAQTTDVRLLITTPSRDPINVARVFEFYDTLTWGAFDGSYAVRGRG
jgi:hypothetical protein